MNKENKASAPTDSEIVFGILNNSESAIKRLYVAYFPMVMQLIINNNGTPDDAKDIYQEAIIVLYNKIKKGDFELKHNLSGYQGLQEIRSEKLSSTSAIYCLKIIDIMCCRYSITADAQLRRMVVDD